MRKQHYSGAGRFLCTYSAANLWQKLNHNYGAELPITVSMPLQIEFFAVGQVKRKNDAELEQAVSRGQRLRARLRNHVRSEILFMVKGDFKQEVDDGFLPLDFEWLTPSMLRGYATSDIEEGYRVERLPGLAFYIGRPLKVVHAAPVSWLAHNSQSGVYRGEAVMTTGRIVKVTPGSAGSLSMAIEDDGDTMQMTCNHAGNQKHVSTVLYRFFASKGAVPAEPEELQRFLMNSQGKEILLGGHMSSSLLVADLFGGVQKYAYVAMPPMQAAEQEAPAQRGMAIPKEISYQMGYPTKGV